MIISHNASALNINNNLRKRSFTISKTMEKLSSGLRINRASDDAAGLAISEKMRAQIRGLNQASRNIQDGISLIQTAEGAMQEIHSMLQRMNELAVQAANGTYNDNDRATIQKELQELKSSIRSITESTNFNGINLLGGTPTTSSVDVTTGGTNKTVLDGDIPIGVNGAVIRINPDEFIEDDEPYSLSINWQDGLPVGMSIHKYYSGLLVAPVNYPGLLYSTNGITFDITNAVSTGSGSQHQGVVVFHSGQNMAPVDPIKKIQLQIGSNSNDTLEVELPNTTLSVLGIASIDFSNQQGASNSIGAIQNAINLVSSERAKLGAYQNRLEHTMNNVSNYAENLTASESRIRDADMAKEMMELTKNQILAQAGQAMLAQANTMPQSILQLLK